MSESMTANQLRRAWTDFFVARGHTAVASASLIPHDPTVLFTVAGMVPFKPYFTGDEIAPYSRAATSQKCVRAGGKHNDLDDVGRTARHLVFFEMLGNFSFGDYFKKDAIPFAWDFTTNVLGFDPEKLWITVHDSDDEAEEMWLDIAKVPKARIQRMGDKDNFWQMGDTGPCGPCSEIYYDRGPRFGPEGGPLNPAADARYLEFWNLVFMQYNQSADGARERLPKPSIDTGAGLERILCLLQGVEAVWDTDLMRPLIEKASSLTGYGYGGSYESDDDLSLRILAEHARSGTMLVADGVFPSNEGRGYVLRRILRRAIRHAYRLGTDKSILPQMVETAIDVMGEAYPDLREKQGRITDIISREEARFRQTLKTGNSILDEELGRLPKGGALAGSVAFQLHDTFGFPLELTREIAEERALTIDQPGFDAEMTAQQERARSARKNSKTPEAQAEAYRAIVERYGVTTFVGYESTDLDDAKVLGVIEADGDDTGEGASGLVEIFLSRTPFYAESGGQIGDTGTITTLDGVAEVLDTTYAIPGLVKHTARVTNGSIEVGETAIAQVAVESRDATRKNHTATHLLHWALREVLGDHVKQQGSLVGPDRLRFDFFHFSALTPQQTTQIEDLVNAVVLTGKDALNQEMTKAEAEELGAIAFFGDKYGDRVRILKAGPSLEFCGGTHVRNVGEIGAVRIVSEGSIGSNVRRIEATTGMQTITRMRADEDLLDSAAALLKAKPEELAARIEKMLTERKELELQLADLRRAAATGGSAKMAASAIEGVVVARVDGVSRDDLKDLALAVRDQVGIRGVVLIGATAGGGVGVVSAVTSDSQLHASNLIAGAMKTLGGGGGKAADLAVAGGRHVEQIDAALAEVRAAAGLK
jgi:alanyl-tRNA synthetase